MVQGLAKAFHFFERGPLRTVLVSPEGRTSAVQGRLARASALALDETSGLGDITMSSSSLLVLKETV